VSRCRNIEFLERIIRARAYNPLDIINLKRDARTARSTGTIKEPIVVKTEAILSNLASLVRYIRFENTRLDAWRSKFTEQREETGNDEGREDDGERRRKRVERSSEPFGRTGRAEGSESSSIQSA